MEAHTCVLPQGTEISVAQAIQCAAASIEIDPVHNPFIVMIGNSPRLLKLGISASCESDPFDGIFSSNTFQPVVYDCLERLASQYDILCIEGAGSPVELGLVDCDVPNVLVSRRLLPVIFLMTEMYRGGGFAHLYGTYGLLPDDLRKCVHGFILNKAQITEEPSRFRQGVAQLEDLTGIPVVGVIPFLENRGIPDEAIDRNIKSSELASISPHIDAHADALEPHIDLQAFLRPIFAQKQLPFKHGL